METGTSYKMEDTSRTVDPVCAIVLDTELYGECETCPTPGIRCKDCPRVSASKEEKQN